MQIKLEKIIIFCADVSKLVSFYKEVLGFGNIKEQNNDWAVIRAGTTDIAFHKIGDQYLNVPKEEFKAESNTKLVFEIDSDIKLFREKLLIQKADIDDIKQFTGADYLVCDGRDPEGNVFQVLQKLK